MWQCRHVLENLFNLLYPLAFFTLLIKINNIVKCPSPIVDYALYVDNLKLKSTRAQQHF